MAQPGIATGRHRDEPGLLELRRELLGFMLLPIGLSMLGATAVTALTGVPWVVVAIAGVGGSAMCVLSRVRGAYTLRAAGLLLYLQLAFLALLLIIGWMPGTALLGLYSVLLAGLLVDRRGARLAIASLIALVALAWGVVAAGLAHPQPATDFNALTNWVRVGSVFAFTTAALTLTLRFILGRLKQARVAALAALEAAQRASDDALATRTLRQAAELQLGDAERLTSVQRLSTGTAMLVERAIREVRESRPRLSAAQSALEVGELGRRIATAALHTSASTRALLAFSRRGQPEPTALPLAPLVRDILPALRHALPDTLLIEAELSETPPVLVDGAGLRQVLLALILNVSDATEGRGTARLRLFADGTNTVLSLSDDGPGIPEVLLSRLGEPYVTSRSEQGHNGLGLFAARGTVSRWGGTLTIESEPGKGATAQITFPPLDYTRPAVSDNSAARSGLQTSLIDQASAPLKQAVSTLAESAPRTEQDESADGRALTRVLGLLTVGSAVALGFAVYVRGVQDAFVSTMLLMLLLSALAWHGRRLSAGVRISIGWLGLLVACGHALRTAGYLAPAAIVALATFPLIAVVFVGDGLAFAAWSITSLTVFSGMFGPLGAEWQPFGTSTSSPVSWLRMMTLYPMSIGVGSELVLAVVDRARRSVVELFAAKARLEDAVTVHRLEEAALAASSRAAQRLEPSEAAGRAAGTVVHDLNNALTGILGWSELLAEAVEPGSPDFAEALEGLDQAAELADSLLLQLAPAPERNDSAGGVAPGSVLPGLLKVLLHRLPPNVRIETDWQSNAELPISADDLRRITLNLAINAGDAMPTGGTLNLRCHRDAASGEVVFEVEDGGMGMDLAIRSRVFEPFFTTKSEDRGTGLGLHTVATVVTRSGGYIQLWSEPGIGTRFTLRWPEPTRTAY